MSLRIGEGIDRHRLEEGLPLVLGGVGIEHSHGLLGHSDGDALTHAICDALLGAGALGDLGTHYADTDPANRGRDSMDFLRGTLDLLRERGLSPVNVDATIMAEAPPLAPHIPEMRRRLSAALGLPLDRVSVKATRGEGVGPEGERLAITARAVVLVEEIS